VSDLLEASRSWVKEHYGHHATHLLKAEEWLRRIDSNATEAMLLATVTHDMERAFPGPDSPKQNPELGPDDPIYNREHSERSARIVGEFLRTQHAPEALITEVANLIRVHEMGGWEEADWVQAADSLSFLEVNIDFFLDRIDAPNDNWNAKSVRAKFDWMYNRIKPQEARELALPLYESAIQKLQNRNEVNIPLKHSEHTESAHKNL
jgi:hypothetical protein